MCVYYMCVYYNVYIYYMCVYYNVCILHVCIIMCVHIGECDSTSYIGLIPISRWWQKIQFTSQQESFGNFVSYWFRLILNPNIFRTCLESSST